MTILGDFSLTGDLIGDKAILFGELGVLILTVGVFILTSISLFSDFVEDNVIITVCLLFDFFSNFPLVFCKNSCLACLFSISCFWWSVLIKLSSKSSSSFSDNSSSSRQFDSCSYWRRANSSKTLLDWALAIFRFCFNCLFKLWSNSAGSSSILTQSVKGLPHVLRKSFWRFFCNFAPTSENISTANLCRSHSFKFKSYWSLASKQTCFTSNIFGKISLRFIYFSTARLSSGIGELFTLTFFLTEICASGSSPISRQYFLQVCTKSSFNFASNKYALSSFSISLKVSSTDAKRLIPCSIRSNFLSKARIFCCFNFFLDKSTFFWLEELNESLSFSSGIWTTVEVTDVFPLLSVNDLEMLVILSLITFFFLNLLL